MSSPEATNVDALVHALEAAHELAVSAAKVAEALSGRSSRVAKGSRSLADETATGTPQRETVEGLCGQIENLADDVAWVLRASAPGRGSIATAAELNGAYTAVVDAVEHFVKIADRVSADHAAVPEAAAALQSWLDAVKSQLTFSIGAAEAIRREGVQTGAERAEAIQAGLADELKKGPELLRRAGSVARVGASPTIEAPLHRSCAQLAAALREAERVASRLAAALRALLGPEA